MYGLLYGHPSSKSQDNFAEMSDNELENYFQTLLNELEKKFEYKIKDFKMYHIDKPIVDFIRVKDNYKRQGIGTKLYHEAANYLKKNNMKLHASGIQSKEAEEAWKKFEKQGMVSSYKLKLSNKKHTRRVLKV